MREKLRPSQAVRRLADEQYGVAGCGELLEAGLSPAAVSRWEESGHLCRLHRGVYAVGHTSLAPQALCLAAVLAGGGGAVLSHGSAAWLWGVERQWRLPVEISVPSRGHGQPGIRVHRTPALADIERTSFEGIPVTSVPRLLWDLALIGQRRRLESAVERAKRRGLLDLIEIDMMLRRHRGAPGTRRLRDALELYRAPVFSRARTELILWQAIDRAGLPRPGINYFVAGYELDAYWEEERFGVELDGWETHQSRQAFEEDRLRPEKLKLAGIDVLRVSARRVERELDDVVRSIARLLAQRRRELRLPPQPPPLERS